MARIALLTIGTEITQGQITNRNATTLSRMLDERGFEIAAHLSVPDEHELIIQALNFLSQQAQFIWVTGGLGPTRDDLTRQAIAAWSQCPLKQDPKIWEWIEKFLQKKGIQPSHSNHQQTYLPTNAQLLFNPAGTAPGFFLKLQHHQILCLPGPPHEIQAILNEKDFEATVFPKIPEGEQKLCTLWKCMGQTEAILGEITEEILKEAPVVTGYRAHSPFVEVKVFYLKKQKNQVQPYLEKVRQALEPWIFTSQDEDFVDLFFKILAEKKIRSLEVLDNTHSSLLMERISPWLFKHQAFSYSTHPLEQGTQVLIHNEPLHAKLAFINTLESHWKIGLGLSNQQWFLDLESESTSKFQIKKQIELGFKQLTQLFT